MLYFKLFVNKKNQRDLPFSNRRLQDNRATDISRQKSKTYKRFTKIFNVKKTKSVHVILISSNTHFM